eukprot:CAMPEP_0172806850 /NCGR_PEP_ID=MMETSP1075-20121228/6625_1 /TAXON_ID=2916 /ORGANISM="Ceratium fusus, Strain PA161109" /LENGTH=47 /DNA_ID= /DNA_START= /DNA_END= /DNA_ORIENTATION=
MVGKHTAMQAKLESMNSIFAVLNALQEDLHFSDGLEPGNVLPAESWI